MDGIPVSNPVNNSTERSIEGHFGKNKPLKKRIKKVLQKKK